MKWGDFLSYLEKYPPKRGIEDDLTIDRKDIWRPRTPKSKRDAPVSVPLTLKIEKKPQSKNTESWRRWKRWTNGFPSKVSRGSLVDTLISAQ